MKELDGRIIAAVVIAAIAITLIIAIYFDEVEWTDGTRTLKARKNPSIDNGPGPLILEGN